MKYLAAVLSCILGVASCAPRFASYPSLIENSGPSELDPVTATFEDHIFTLSPLKSAVPTSQEYRDRLREGYRHPKTRARKDEEFVYIPEKATAQFNREAHAYLLNRTSKRFSIFFYGPEKPFPHHEFFRDDRGWWLENPFAMFRPSTK
jgi:hypothetical protein